MMMMMTDRGEPVERCETVEEFAADVSEYPLSANGRDDHER